MSDIHAVPPNKPPEPGLCGWSWRWEDVVLRCTERAIPGSGYCGDHLIELHDEMDEG